MLLYLMHITRPDRGERVGWTIIAASSQEKAVESCYVPTDGGTYEVRAEYIGISKRGYLDGAIVATSLFG